MSNGIYDPTKLKEIQHDNLIKHILLYVKRRWPVFPCKPNKTPYTSNGFYDATTDVEQIVEWWNEHPTALIGIPTGKVSGFWVVDLDVKDGKDGIAALTKYVESQCDNQEVLGEDWLIQKTTTEGVHLLFKMVEGIEVRNKTAVLGKDSGIDIRGDGGYIIAAPSYIKTDKWRYYGWNDIENNIVPEPPEWAIKLTEKTSSPENKQFNLQQAIENGISEGSRDDDLFRVACVLNKQGVTFDTANTFIQLLAERCDPPFSSNEARRKVEYVYSTYSVRSKVNEIKQMEQQLKQLEDGGTNNE